jgi:hypothetical protein
MKPDLACVECWTALLFRLKIYQATRGTEDRGSLYSSSGDGNEKDHVNYACAYVYVQETNKCTLLWQFISIFVNFK